MTQNLFEEIMGELGAHTEGTTAFGVSDGYPYSAEMVSGRAPLTFALRFVVAGDAKPAITALKEQHIPHLRWLAEPDTAGSTGGEIYTALVGVLRPPSDFYTKAELHGLMVAATKTLAAASLSTPKRCPLCQLESCDHYAFLEGSYRETHAACLKTRLTLPEEDTAVPATVRGSRLAGILGAVLGALLGALPNWAQALSAGRVHAVLYAFIPFLSALLYRLFRGRASRNFSAITVLTASVATAFLMELFWYWMVLSDSFSINITFLQSVQTYLSTHDFISSIQEMLFSLIFLLVGYFAATVLLRRYANSGAVQATVVPGRRYVLASARPIRSMEESEPTDATIRRTDNTAADNNNEGGNPDE